MLEGGRTGTIHFGPRGQRRMEDVAVFIQSFAPPPRMYVFGAIDFASAVARIGKFMGYRVTVCDARPVFATRERFPTADEVVVAWQRSEERRVGEECRYWRDWSSDVCSSDLSAAWRTWRSLSSRSPRHPGCTSSGP